MGKIRLDSEDYPQATNPPAGKYFIGIDTATGKLASQNSAGTVVDYTPTSAPVITGSRGTPTNIVAANGITPGGGYQQIQYIQGNAGNITVTHNPQVIAGAMDGETMELRGRNDSQTVTIADGTGLSLNGSMTIKADDSITLRWDGTNWVEIARRENA